MAAYSVPPSTSTTQAAPGSSAPADHPPPGAPPAPSSQSRAQSGTVPAPAPAGTGGAGSAAPAPDGGSAPGGSSGTTVPVPINGDGTMTAAQRYGWGSPARVDDFTAGLGQWSTYDGPGHAGNGMRSPGAVTVQNGVLTISGDARGTTGGMRWDFGSRYGAGRARCGRRPATPPTTL
jgi:hypothetical protein